MTTFIESARKLGASAGKAAGSWVIDGNTPAADAQRILKGYEDGDPAIFDIQPSPLSGEWADTPTEDDVLDEIAAESKRECDVPDDERDEILSAFLDGFSEGFWDEVIRHARIVAKVAA